ncbi:hypothetical protein GCM10018954_028420 [Kutzneria kofuensis]
MSIAKRLPTGRVVLTDLVPEMLDIATRRARAQGVANIETTVCSADDLPFDDATFDSVSVRFGYMFFPDVAKATAEFARVLKPGGRLCSSVWVKPEENPWTAIAMRAIAAETVVAPPDRDAPDLRSFWKGSIGFGLVSIPVKAYKATEERGLGLHQVHAADGGRIRLSRYCEIDGAEVPASEVGRAADTGGGDVVLITDEDLAGLPVPTLRTIAVHTFAPPSQIDPLYLSRSYYLEPDTDGVRPYVLFAEALRRSGKVAVVKVAFRQRETLGMLRVRDNVLVLETMVWPAEIRTPDFPFLDEDVDVRLPELKAATALIDCLSGTSTPPSTRTPTARPSTS